MTRTPPPTTTAITRLGVARGDGVLVRRDDALLYLSPTGTRTAALAAIADDFLSATDAHAARDAVTAAVVAARFEVEPFVVITWLTTIDVMVVGDIEVTSDLPTLPMLSGRGSASWVEHRAPRQIERCELRVGAAPDAPTDLRAGIVPAGGFSLVLQLGVPAAPPEIAPPGAPPLDAAPPDTAPPGLATAAGRATSAIGAHDSAASWAALQAATGGDWMEDSLGLPQGDAPVARAAPPGPGPDLDPEVTLDPATFHAAAPAASEMPGTPQTAETGARATVQARRCPRQHVNPLTAATCRQCRQPIDPAAPVETVVQPALASVVLPDGVTVPIDGSLVLGRQPDAAAARVTDPCDLWPLAAGTDVSRTHLVLRAIGWTIEAVDCGSTGHTVLVPGRGGDPVELAPWVPHEVVPGDTIYLGGPTNVRVVA